jgi:septum formation protein
MPTSLVLASRSPRRRELLAALCPATEIEILPPPDSTERSLADCHDWPSIEARIRLIAREKADAVDALLRQRPVSRPAILIAADTAIVVRDSPGRLRVLEQPPEDDTWQKVVREWFQRHYLGQTHWALTGLCVRWPQGELRQAVVRTAVTFHDASALAGALEWYLATGESRGKAGGYAIQGAGSVFVSRVEGSLSNVIGLPLEPLREWICEAPGASPRD